MSNLLIECSPLIQQSVFVIWGAFRLTRPQRPQLKIFRYELEKLYGKKGRSGILSMAG